MKVSEAIKRLKRMDPNAELAMILDFDGYCQIITKFKTVKAVDAKGDGGGISFADGVLRFDKDGNVKVIIGE